MLLIDGMMLVRKCYEKLDFLKNSSDQPTGMEFGFLRTLEKLQKLHPKSQIITCWDSPHNKRKELYPQYKAGRRRMPDTFWPRVKVFKEFLSHLYPYAELDGYEADDVIATLALLNKKRFFVYVFADDNDFLQLICDKVEVIKSFQSQLYYWNTTKVKERYGVLPSEMPLFRAIIGDTSDNVPGVKRLHRSILAVKINETRNIPNINDRIIKILEGDCWSDSMLENLIKFVRSGNFKRNYELMKLRIIKEIVLQPVDKDDDAVRKQLLEWEIKSLKLCKRFFGEVKENAEF